MTVKTRAKHLIALKACDWRKTIKVFKSWTFI